MNMKKILSFFIVVFVAISASAQMYIWHNDQIIGEYDILNVDSVSFRKIVYHSVDADEVVGGEIMGLGNYPEGANLQVTAVAAKGYVFKGWCDITSSENPREITVTEDVRLCATFEKENFTIATSVSDEAMGRVTETAIVPFGEELTITATANLGCKFASWSDGSTENPRTIVVDKNQNLTALFVTEIFNVTTTLSNDTYGYVVGAGKYPYNSEISVYACSTSKGKFVQWSDGSTENPRHIIVTGDSVFTAEFIEKEHVEPEQPQEPELTYDLRILTFEDKDAKFEEYTLIGGEANISTWSDLIDEPQYGGALLYPNYATGAWEIDYTWYDENNTGIRHTSNTWGYSSGGHAISNYASKEYGYTNEDRDILISKWYGDNYVEENAGNDAALGWFNVQLTTPTDGGHSGENFAVHFGYVDHYSMSDIMQGFEFEDGEARVIDHMYVTNTNYTLNQMIYGVGSEAGNNFGGNYEEISENSWLKITAYGYANLDDEDADSISSVDFYLLKDKQFITDWTKWDLSSLGKVAKVCFNMHYSEDMGGKFGFTIPAYFAYDDVAVRFDKE